MEGEEYTSVRDALVTGPARGALTGERSAAARRLREPGIWRVGCAMQRARDS